MTSRVPLFNFVIPFLVLYPIPNNIFWGNQGKILLSIFIVGGIYHSSVKVLVCRHWTTRLFLILLGTFMSFSRTEKDFLKPLICPSEINASINLNEFYQTKCGTIHKTVKINEIQESKVHWHGKDAIIENQYGLLNKVRFLSKNFIVKGLVFQNDFNLPALAISKIIKDKNQGILKKVSDRKDIIITNFWFDSKASSKTKSFIIAFTTGSKRYIDDDSKDTYISTGVMHLFAVSGLHFGILYFVLKFIIYLFSNNKILTTFILISVLFYYLSFIGFPYSAQRAFLMIFVWEISNLILKRKCAISALTFSFAITSLVQPESIYEPGLQLSFTIVLLIIWFSRGTSNISDKKSFFIYLYGFVKCSLAAFCGSFFILLGSFGQIVPISIISNIILIPLAFALMIIFIIYLTNLYLLNIDFYFVVDFIYFAILELLLFLNDLPLSYFSVNLEVNSYIYIILPIFVIYNFNNRWKFFKKFIFTFLVSFSSVLYVTYF